MSAQAPKHGRRSRRGAKGISDEHRAYLGRSRRRRHDAVADEQHTAAAIPDHPLICADETEFVTDQARFDELMDAAAASGSFAFDTEFIGEQSYYPQLCLVQVATPEWTAVIDTVADLNIERFWQLVADASVEKIVHAGLQDLEPAARITGQAAANVFDTQIAAGFVGLPYPLNLRELVLKFTGAKLHKSNGFTQWDERPLTSAQLRYAADDVRYLPAVRAALTELLADTPAAKWAASEMAAACELASTGYDSRRAALRMKGAKDLSSRQLAVMAELLAWRESYAAACDAPARVLMADDTVRTIARKHKYLNSVGDLYELGCVASRILSECGDEIVAALTRGAAAECEGLSRSIPSQESADTRQLIDHMWALMQVVAFDQNVHPTLVTSRKELAQLLNSDITDKKARKTTADLTQLKTSTLSTGWRGELLKPLLESLKKHNLPATQFKN